MLAILTEWGLGLGAIGCVAGAVASFIYVPVIGRYAAGALLIVAAGLGAYNAGYVARGRLDRSLALEAQLAEARRELSATQVVQEAAATRARESEQQAANLQEKIDDYAAKLAAKPAAENCLLSRDDVRALDGLRDDARSGRASHAPGRPR